MNDDDPTRLLADLDFVRAVARRLCRDDDEADDLAQDTLVRALDRPPEHGGSRRGWLATVARNLFKNRVRDDARRLERERRREPADLEVPSTEEVVALEQQRRLVVEAVLALPERYREVVLLRHFRSVDIATSARRLGLSETAVRTRLSRANLMLKEHLDRRHGGDRARWVMALLPLTVPTPRDALVVAAAAAGGSKLLAALVAAVLVLGLGVVWWSATPPLTTAVPATTPTNAAAPAHVDATTPAADAARPRTPASTPDRVLATPSGTPDPGLHDLHGFVRREDGTPVANVPVRLRAQVGEHPGPRERFELGVVHTDDDGRFVVSLEPLRQLTTAARSQLYVRADTVAAEHPSHGSHPLELANLLRRSGDEPAFTLLLQKEPLVTGWVVDSNGRGVPEALLCYRVGDDHGEDTCSDDGRYHAAVGYDFEAGQDLALYAAHRRFGISDVHHVRVNADGHTPVPDLVLRPAPTRVEGTVRWPDGSGAAGVEVRFERMDDEADAASRPTRDLRTIAGRVAHADERKHPSIDTDADGRFTIAFLRPGRYVFEFGTGESFEFDVPAGVVTRIDHRMRPVEQTQLRVHVVDEQGLSLSDSWLGLHHWRGAHAAATAAARFAAEGPSADLLATADHFDKMFYLDERLFDVQPDSFVVAEAACHDRGPAYAATLVARGQGRAEITVLLAPRAAKGALRLEVRDPSGAELAGPHFVRVCRGHAGHALPVLLPDCDTRSGPTSGIAGFWHVVPDDGVLRDLPAGGLTLQVLANVTDDGERCTRAPWPLEQRFVELAADDDLRVDVATRPGSHIELDVIAHDTAKHGIEVNATIWPAGGGARREQFVTPDRAARYGAFVDGRVRLRSISALAPGRYRIAVRTDARLYDAAIPDRNVHWQRTVTLPLAAPVQVQLTQR